MLSTFNFDVDVPFLIYVVKRSDEDEAIPVADGEYIQKARCYQILVSPWARIKVIAVLPVVIGTKSIVYDISPISSSLTWSLS